MLGSYFPEEFSLDWLCSHSGQEQSKLEQKTSFRSSETEQQNTTTRVQCTTYCIIQNKKPAVLSSGETSSSLDQPQINTQILQEEESQDIYINLWNTSGHPREIKDIKQNLISNFFIEDRHQYLNIL